MLLLQYRPHMRAELVPLGLALYYSGWISLVERRARYVPWARGLSWQTATRAERPVVYWLVVSSSFCLSGLFLALALLSGRVEPTQG
jgi:hypothetical protein